MHFTSRPALFPDRESGSGRFLFGVKWPGVIFQRIRPGVMGRFFAGILVLLSLLAASARGEDHLEKVTSESRVAADREERWRYFLYLPQDYEENEQALYPCLFWLHGRSLRGDDLEKTRRYGPPAMLTKRGDYPFVVICPQLPDGAWPAAGLKALLDESLERYRIDPDRVILMGASLGAMGAWNFAGAYPDAFAALIPICAHGPDWVAPKLVDLPIRAVHGDADEIVPMEAHVRLIEKIRKLGGDARIEIVPGGDHGSVIGPSYRDESWIEWMLEQVR
jgi:predicted peptidase